MKRIYLLLFSALAFFNMHAQVITANDSASTGSGNNNMCFYNLSTGQKTMASNTDWHLAITVRATNFPSAPLGGTTIRINEQNGVKVYYVPNADAASFNTVDTTGYRYWTQLHDADTVLDEGALNSNRDRTNIFDFGWGLYNSSVHNVVGDSLYLIELPNGELKKFMVVNLDKDTAFNLRYANIDNSFLQNVHIGKKDYLGKNFVYLNLTDNMVHDKEPLSANWDLLFAKYAANDFLPDSIHKTVGVLSNTGITIAKTAHVALSTDSYYPNPLSPYMNAIGWNWKNNTNVVEDSLIYFVQARDAQLYKIIFTGYTASTGVASFYKQLLVTGIEETNADNAITVFPNPASNKLSITSRSAQRDETNYQSSIREVKVFDATGRELINQPTSDNGRITLAINSLPNGIYFLSLNDGSHQVMKKFIVAK